MSGKLILKDLGLRYDIENVSSIAVNEFSFEDIEKGSIPKRMEIVPIRVTHGKLSVIAGDEGFGGAAHYVLRKCGLKDWCRSWSRLLTCENSARLSSA